MVVEIEDHVTSQLEAIRLTAPELAREQMSKVGNDVRRSMRANMLKHRHHMFANRPNRDEKITFYRDKRKSKRLGTESGDSNRDMSNRITSYLDEKNGILVVGGVHRKFNPILRKDGEIVGKGAKVDGVGRQTMAIIDKLDTGEVGDDYGQYINGKFNDNPFEKGQTFRAYGFKKEAIRNTAAKVNSRITTEYDRLYMKTEQNLKTEPRRSRFA